MIQTSVSVSGTNITGTLNYLDSTNGGAIVSEWGAGHFLFVKFSGIDSDATSVKVGLSPSAGSGLVELINDPDKNGVFKISNKETQRLTVISSDASGNSTAQYFDLSGLTLATS